MAKMMKLTDGGKVLVDSFGRAKEGKCCCPSTLDCTACNATSVAATTAIVTISGFAGPVPGASTYCGSQCTTFNGTFYLPFSFGTTGPNYTCSWRLPVSICAMTYFEFAITYNSAGKTTEIVVQGDASAGSNNNFYWRTTGIQGRLDCHQTFSIPFAGILSSTDRFCNGDASTCTVVLS